MKAKMVYVALALALAMGLAVAVSAVSVSANGPVDSVDIGNTSEGHSMQGWGPIVPPPGNWGNFSITGEKCRAVWSPGESSPIESWASFNLNTSIGMKATELKLRVLDGVGNDSFKVYVNDSHLVETYTDLAPTDDPEIWYIHSIDISGLTLSGSIKVTINSTASKWGSWGIYGQLGVDWAELYAEPAADGGMACFIATAAYGTASAAEIDVLRAFRDGVLLESTVGSQLVEWYYQTSPPVADFISGNGPLRTVVRELVIDPMVSVATFTQGIWGK